MKVKKINNGKALFHENVVFPVKLRSTYSQGKLIWHEIWSDSNATQGVVLQLSSGNAMTGEQINGAQYHAHINGAIHQFDNR